jgi:hypothetical protein
MLAYQAISGNLGIGRKCNILSNTSTCIPGTNNKMPGIRNAHSMSSLHNSTPCSSSCSTISRQSKNNNSSLHLIREAFGRSSSTI